MNNTIKLEIETTREEVNAAYEGYGIMPKSQSTNSGNLIRKLYAALPREVTVKLTEAQVKEIQNKEELHYLASIKFTCDQMDQLRSQLSEPKPEEFSLIEPEVTNNVAYQKGEGE